jgi:hypothetical protein
LCSGFSKLDSSFAGIKRWIQNTGNWMAIALAVIALCAATASALAQAVERYPGDPRAGKCIANSWPITDCSMGGDRQCRKTMSALYCGHRAVACENCRGAFLSCSERLGLAVGDASPSWRTGCNSCNRAALACFKHHAPPKHARKPL